MVHPYEQIEETISTIQTKIFQDHELLTHRYPVQDRLTDEEVDDQDCDLYRAIELLNKAKRLVEEYTF